MQNIPICIDINLVRKGEAEMRQLKITKSITNRDSSSLEKYLQDVGKEEMISAEEEVELAQRIKKGDRCFRKINKSKLAFCYFCR
mgnify:CR=1 FL=1